MLFFCNLQLIDHTCAIPVPEPIADIDNTNTDGASCQHPQQRGDTAEVCPIPDTGGYRNSDRIFFFNQSKNPQPRIF